MHMMINTTPPLTTWFLNVYIFVVITTVLTPMSLGLELWIMRSMAILATLYHVHYVTSLVRQISRHLGIKVFTVKETKQH
uniref:Uncharacterized protein n=1 Tax=Romanomermis culicivorax TaxID=13658 RepID=A0A915K0E3_ROMCU